MTQDSCWPVQAGVYARLAGDAALTALLADGAASVFDHVPQGSAFPYIVIANIAGQPVETQGGDDSGFEVTLEVQGYSRAFGMKELRGIMAAVAASLHGASFGITGQRLVFCRLVAQQTQLQPDGETRMGVARFRLMTEPL